MPGFPTRPRRAALGPTYRNKRPVRIETEEFGATPLNLNCWLVAGAGGVVPQAWLLATFTGPSTIAVTAHREAWDPNATDDAPTIARGSTGVYTVTYEQTYPDETGTEVSVQLYGGIVAPQGNTILGGNCQMTNAYTVEVYVCNLANVATDSTFMLVMW
jgi:hypothetical protein